MNGVYDLVTAARRIILGGLVGVVIGGCSTVPGGVAARDPQTPPAAAPLPASAQLAVKCTVEGDYYVVELHNPTREPLRYFTYKSDVPQYRDRDARNPLGARLSVRGPNGMERECEGHLLGSQIDTGAWKEQRLDSQKTKRFRFLLADLFAVEWPARTVYLMLHPGDFIDDLSREQMRAARFKFKVRVAIILNHDYDDRRYVACESDWHDF